MRSAINKVIKTYAIFDESNPDLKAFAKLWIKNKKLGRNDSDFGIKIGSGRSGFVGSGARRYEFNGKKFSVNEFANGKGFWGTDYSISSEVTE